MVTHGIYFAYIVYRAQSKWVYIADASWTSPALTLENVIDDNLGPDSRVQYNCLKYAWICSGPETIEILVRVHYMLKIMVDIILKY